MMSTSDEYYKGVEITESVAREVARRLENNNGDIEVFRVDKSESGFWVVKYRKTVEKEDLLAERAQSAKEETRRVKEILEESSYGDDVVRCLNGTVSD